MDRQEIRKIWWAALATVVILVTMNAERWYWKYWNHVPLVLYGGTASNPNEKIKVLNPDNSVCAGELMKYEVDLDKRMDVACTVKRQLVNSYLIPYDPYEPPRKELGRQKAKGALHIPGKTDPGSEWFMRWTSECEVGPDGLKVATTAVSNKFTILDCSTPTKGAKGDIGKDGKPGKDGKDFWGSRR
jgi:hypothetical protein